MTSLIFPKLARSVDLNGIWNLSYRRMTGRLQTQTIHGKPSPSGRELAVIKHLTSQNNNCRLFNAVGKLKTPERQESVAPDSE